MSVAGVGGSFSAQAGASNNRNAGDTQIRDSADTNIFVFCRVEAASKGLVKALALTFAMTISSIILYIWSAHDLSTSVSVTIFVGLVVLVIMFNRETYITLPGSVVPPGPTNRTESTNINVNLEISVGGASIRQRWSSVRSTKVDFFSDIAKPALHDIRGFGAEARQ